MTHKITREYEKKMSEISPFELKNILIDLADESARKSTHIMLNAGRGNPNWISTVPREAFFLLGQFGLEECARSSEYGEEMVGLAGIPEKRRIATRFTQFLMKHAGSPGMALLKDTYDYLVNEKGVDENDLVHEWTEGVIGDPISRSRPYPEIYGSAGRRLLETGVVRQPPAQREVRPFRHRRRDSRDVLYIRFPATKFPSRQRRPRSSCLPRYSLLI